MQDESDETRPRDRIAVALIFGSPALAVTTSVWAGVIDRHLSTSFWFGPSTRAVFWIGAILAFVGTVAGCLSMRDRLMHRVITAAFLGPTAFVVYLLATALGIGIFAR